jgi:hypothetical protein
MYKWIATAICFLLISGCATHKSEMESWLGHQESELVSTWGAPNKALDTRDGKRILTWEFPWQLGQIYGTCRKSFTVDEAGIIKAYSYGGCL